MGREVSRCACPCHFVNCVLDLVLETSMDKHEGQEGWSILEKATVTPLFEWIIECGPLDIQLSAMPHVPVRSKSREFRQLENPEG